MTNSGKSVIWTQDYYPFGGSLSGGDLGDDQQGFTNQLVDQDAGLYYFRARWYDPEMGRFYSLDPAGQGTNPYAYAGNNPITNIDPMGLWVSPGSVGLMPMGTDLDENRLKRIMAEREYWRINHLYDASGMQYNWYGTYLYMTMHGTRNPDGSWKSNIVLRASNKDVLNVLRAVQRLENPIYNCVGLYIEYFYIPIVFDVLSFAYFDPETFTIGIPYRYSGSNSGIFGAILAHEGVHAAMWMLPNSQFQEYVAMSNMINYWKGTQGNRFAPSYIQDWIDIYDYLGIGMLWEIVQSAYQKLPTSQRRGSFEYSWPGVSFDWLPWWAQ